MQVYDPDSKVKAFFNDDIFHSNILNSAFCLLHSAFYSSPLKYRPLVQEPGLKGSGRR